MRLLVAGLLCGLAAGLAVAVAPAAAEPADVAEVRDLNDGGMVFAAITGPAAPEEYPYRVNLGEEQRLVQVNETLAEVVNPGHERALTINAEPAADAEGATVPPTLALTGPDEITLTVHYRGGNPAAGGAPFVYPITAGKGWSGGFQTTLDPMTNPLGEPPQIEPERRGCSVPSLRGLGLRAAKARLRAAGCAIGQVRLAPGVGPAKGKVVKQFRPAGASFAAGAPVAIKLGRG